MFRFMNEKSVALILVSLAITATSAAAHAEGKSASRCDSQQLAAWFDAQRQLTDGSADPYAHSAGNAACTLKAAQVEEEKQPASKVAQR